MKYDTLFSYEKLDWSPGMMIPFDIQLMYLIQCGFYLHSIYATIYMDYKRKDYYAMLIHHALTLALMLVSYGTRLNRILFCFLVKFIV